MFKVFYPFSVLKSLSALVLTQGPPPKHRRRPAGVVACQSLLLFAILAFIALNVALLFWVYRDAQNRGMEYGILWLVIVFVFGPLAAIVYVFARQKGSLVPCARCGSRRLDVSANCPHCGNA